MTLTAPHAARQAGRGLVRFAWPVAREIVVVGFFLFLYKSGRLLSGHDTGLAFANAHRLWDLERTLRLPSEQSLQGLVLPVSSLVEATNWFYAHVNFPVTGAVLLWLLLRRPTHYYWAKWALISASLSSLLIFLLVPMAPPRMLPELGFIDTGVVFGQSPYADPQVAATSNQYAAMPSLHVGWALLVAVVLITACRGRTRWLWIGHPVLTLFAVVATGNHFWADAVVGSALVAGALVLTRGLIRSAPPAAERRERSPAEPACAPRR
ncbi:MAG: sle [Frankiales bacterium]|nr:sle [Frankiales bacterium]